MLHLEEDLNVRLPHGLNWGSPSAAIPDVSILIVRMCGVSVLTTYGISHHLGTVEMAAP